MFEPKDVALLRRKMRRGEFPLHAAAIGQWFARQNRRARAIAKQATADEHTRIVIQKKRGAANFNANR